MNTTVAETKTKAKRCQACVYKREQYRRTGRGPTGFEMHYTESQCSRKAKDGADMCWQHAGHGYMKIRYPQEFIEAGAP